MERSSGGERVAGVGRKIDARRIRVLCAENTAADLEPGISGGRHVVDASRGEAIDQAGQTRVMTDHHQVLAVGVGLDLAYQRIRAGQVERVRVDDSLRIETEQVADDFSGFPGARRGAADQRLRFELPGAQALTHLLRFQPAPLAEAAFLVSLVL